MNRIYLWLNELYWKLRRKPWRSIKFLRFMDASEEHMMNRDYSGSRATLDDFTGMGKSFFSGNPRAFISDEEE